MENDDRLKELINRMWKEEGIEACFTGDGLMD